VVDGRYDYDEYDINEPNKMEVPVSLIIWGDLKKISSSFDEHFGSVLLQDVLRVVRNNESVKVRGVLDNVGDVFREFTIRDENASLFYYPYFCYRIELVMATQEDCEDDILTALSDYDID
jgi:predicted RNA-binding protein